MKLKPFLTVILMVLIIILKMQANAQVSEKYYSDTEPKEGGKVNCHIMYKNQIIIGGKTFEKSKNQPSLICIDTLGNTVWNTADNDETAYSGEDFRIYKCMIGEDGYLYAVCLGSLYTDFNQLWKVDPSNGTIIWKVPFKSKTSYSVRFIIDYDSTKFIVAHNYAQSQADKIITKIEFVSKSSGNVISGFLTGNEELRYGLCIDNKKDIYYSKSDSIFKVSGTNPGNIIWKTKHPTAKVSDYHFIHFDSTSNSLLFIGYGNGFRIGKIVKINASDGSLISTQDAQQDNDDVEFQSMKVVGNDLYIIWRNIYFGAGKHRFYTTKYNMATSSIVWRSEYSFSNNIGSQSAMSLDIDRFNNIYQTGYFRSPDYGPGSWGILKLNGKNGKAIYEKTITQKPQYNSSSMGMATCVVNDLPYFVGELESEDSNRSRVTLIKLDSANGNTTLQKYIGGKFQFASKTLQIKNYPSKGTILLKQIGRAIEVCMYDKKKDIKWTRTLSRDYFLFGGEVAVSPNDDIFISAYSNVESNIYPFYNTDTKKIYVFHINGEGETIKEYKFDVDSYRAFPTQFLFDNLSTFIFYLKGQKIFCRKISSSQISDECDLDIHTDDIVPITKNYINLNKDTVAMFKYGYFASQMIGLNKNTMKVSYISTISPPLYFINYAEQANGNLVVLSGKSESNQESVGVYDISSRNFVWSKTLSANSNTQVVKSITDKQKKFVYTVSHRTNTIIVRKLSLAKGEEIWEYTKTSNTETVPLDIAYDNFRNQVTISGYETDFQNNKKVSVTILDSKGKALLTITKAGDSADADNNAFCTEVLEDGSQWIGGSLNREPYGQAGFLYEIENEPIPELAEEDDKKGTNEVKKSIAFPNPSSSEVTFKFENILKNATLTIYNSSGQLIKEIINIKEQEITLHLDNLKAGWYFVRIITEKEVAFSGKIMIN